MPEGHFFPNSSSNTQPQTAAGGSLITVRSPSRSGITPNTAKSPLHQWTIRATLPHGLKGQAGREAGTERGEMVQSQLKGRRMGCRPQSSPAPELTGPWTELLFHPPASRLQHRRAHPGTGRECFSNHRQNPDPETFD